MDIKNQNIALMLLLVIFSACLRYPFVDLGSIWFDEAWRIYDSKLPLDSYSFNSINKFFSYEGLLKFIGKFIGTDGWSYRIPSNLAGIFCVPALFYLSLIITNNRYISLIAAVLTALNPWHIAYSVEVAPYSIGSLLVIILFISLIRLHETNKNIYFLFSLLISIFLGCLHLYLLGFSFMIISFSLFLDWRKSSFRKKIIFIAFILVCMILFKLKLMYGWINLIADTKPYVNVNWFLEFPRLLLNSLLSGPSYDAYAPTASNAYLVYRTFISIIVCSVFLIFTFSIYEGWRGYNRKIKYVIFTVFLYILFVYFQALAHSYGYYLRYLIPIVPVLILLITLAIGLRIQKNKIFLKALLIIIIINYLIVFKLDSPWVKNKPQWRNLYKELSSKCENNPTFFIIPNYLELTITKFYLNNTACNIIEQPSFDKFFIGNEKLLVKQSIKDQEIEDIYLSNNIKEILKSNKNITFYIVARRQKNRVDSIIKHNKIKAKTVDGLPSVFFVKEIIND